jgi:hypothetical protein
MVQVLSAALAKVLRDVHSSRVPAQGLLFEEPNCARCA